MFPLIRKLHAYQERTVLVITSTKITHNNTLTKVYGDIVLTRYKNSVLMNASDLLY